LLLNKNILHPQLDNVLRRAAPGTVSSKRILNSIYSCAQDTLNSNKKDLEILTRTVSKIELFAIESGHLDAHVYNISKGKFTYIAAAGKDQKRCMDLVRREYSLGAIFFDLCRELGEAMRSLIIGNYSRVSRSLRWIVESAVFWTDMQGDYETASARYEYYTTFHVPMDNKEYSYLRRYVSDLKHALLEERLSVKLKWKRYRIGDMLDNVILKTEGVAYEKPKGHSLKTKIEQTYKELSAFDHISMDSLQEIDKTLRTDYAIYMDHEYDLENYSYQFVNVWNVVDLVISIVVLAGKNFYEYSTTHDYLDKMQKYYKKESSTKGLIDYIDSKKIGDKLRLLSLML
jgi:hypothetical protein